MGYLNAIATLFVAVLICRKTALTVRRKAVWVAIVVVAAVLPEAIALAIGAISNSVFLMILNPFIAIASLAAPWIVLAILNDRIENGKVTRPGKLTNPPQR